MAPPRLYERRGVSHLLWRTSSRPGYPTPRLSTSEPTPRVSIPPALPSPSPSRRRSGTTCGPMFVDGTAVAPASAARLRSSPLKCPLLAWLHLLAGASGVGCAWRGVLDLAEVAQQRPRDSLRAQLLLLWRAPLWRTRSCNAHAWWVDERRHTRQGFGPDDQLFRRNCTHLRTRLGAMLLL